MTGYRRADGKPCGSKAMSDPDLRVDVTTFPGWSEDIRSARSVADLPPAAATYVQALAAYVGVPVALDLGRPRTFSVRPRAVSFR